MPNSWELSSSSRSLCTSAVLPLAVVRVRWLQKLPVPRSENADATVEQRQHDQQRAKQPQGHQAAMR